MKLLVEMIPSPGWVDLPARQEFEAVYWHHRAPTGSDVELQSRLNAPEMPELMHPRMADIHPVRRSAAFLPGWRTRSAARAPQEPFER